MRRTGSPPKNRAAVALARRRAASLGAPARSAIARAAATARWRGAADPFANAQPITDLSRMIGGLPDDRTAEEILADLAQARRPRGARR
jgi:hypothetical protein